jgi:hypothetical protein
MARSIFKAKTSKVNRPATSAPSPDASAYCRDLGNWPHSWMGLEKDIPPGEKLVACLRPFIEHLASSGLSPKTIRRHVDNLWTLGGEIIRDLNYIPSRRKVAANKLLRDAVHTDGGPLIYNGSEEEQRSFDSTCRILHRFLSQPPALSPNKDHGKDGGEAALEIAPRFPLSPQSRRRRVSLYQEHFQR